MVSDAKTFGRIAAANALSDIYAMGGKPLYALNLVCFPQELDQGILSDILSGGMEKCVEAGAVLAGGHSIYDSGIKYGLAVTGIVQTDKLYRNNTTRTGDSLILTKPLGTGIITAAGRDGSADPSDMAEVTESMERLNKYASEKMAAYDVSACTDVTGFGLAVHALEMAAGNVTIEINCAGLPFFDRIRRYIGDGYITGGGLRNRDFACSAVDIDGVPPWIQELVFDPQTSGGLLIAVSAGHADSLLREIQTGDPKAAIIGSVTQRGSFELVFR